MADLTQDEAIERARAIEVDSYEVFLDLAAEPALSRTEGHSAGLTAATAV